MYCFNYVLYRAARCLDQPKHIKYIVSIKLCSINKPHSTVDCLPKNVMWLKKSYGKYKMIFKKKNTFFCCFVFNVNDNEIEKQNKQQQKRLITHIDVFINTG